MSLDSITYRLAPRDQVSILADGLRTDFSKMKKIRNQYLYWGSECANNWIELSDIENQTTPYDLSKQAREVLNKNIKKVIETIFINEKSLFNIISLGVGDGQDDIFLFDKYYELAKISNLKHREQLFYFPVDISYDLLLHTIKNLKDVTQHIGFEAMISEFDLSFVLLNDDFTTYTPFERVKSISSVEIPRLFLLLGGTIGNYQDEWGILEIIQTNMENDDYLLIGVDCCYGVGFLSKDDIEQIYDKARFDHYGRKFIAGPLKSIEFIGIEKEKKICFGPNLHNEIITKTKVSKLGSRVKENAVSVMHEYHPSTSELIEVLGSSPIRIDISRKYSINAFKTFLIECGFSVVLDPITPGPFTEDGYSDSYYVLFLLKKSDTQQTEPDVPKESNYDLELLSNKFKLFYLKTEIDAKGFSKHRHRKIAELYKIFSSGQLEEKKRISEKLAINQYNLIIGSVELSEEVLNIIDGINT